MKTLGKLYSNTLAWLALATVAAVAALAAVLAVAFIFAVLGAWSAPSTVCDQTASYHSAACNAR